MVERDERWERTKDGVQRLLQALGETELRASLWRLVRIDDTIRPEYRPNRLGVYVVIARRTRTITIDLELLGEF